MLQDPYVTGGLPENRLVRATRQLSKDQDTASIPVIMVTTKAQETDKNWGLRQGAKEYVVKPVNHHELLTKIGALLGD